MRNGNWVIQSWQVKTSSVFTLPMRNGNCLPMAIWRNILKVFTLPMRNGNMLIVLYQFVKESSFYLTYEEWKHKFWMISPVCSLLFLPYLWGMETFEDIWCKLPKNSVFTLPMRNGNRLFRKFPWNKYHVFTLPMRNGNTMSIYRRK